MKTEEEFKERLTEVWLRGIPPFSTFQVDALIEVAPWSAVEGLVVEGTTEASWNGDDDIKPYTAEGVVERMKEYMAFAWEKCLDHRGISAQRSITRFEEWVWILDDDALTEEFNSAAYENYGAPKLRALCELFGWEWPGSEGKSGWGSAQSRRMAEGKPCDPAGCAEGCGS